MSAIAPARIPPIHRSHQISNGDAGQENRSDEESQKGQAFRIHRHDVNS